MANVTYIVQSGDTLSSIARKYNTTINALTKLNDISNPNSIYVGQRLIISSDSTESEPVSTFAMVRSAAANSRATTSGSSNTVTVTEFGLQPKTTRTVYANWTWDKTHTESFDVKWTYYIGTATGFVEQSSVDGELRQALYTAPDTATHVTFQCRPVSETKTSGTSSSKYWTADWSTLKTYDFSNNPPTEPGVPTVEIKDYTLTATLDNVDTVYMNAKQIQFEVVKDNSYVFATGKSEVKTSHASFSCKVDAGGEYKVRCRSVDGKEYSEWSEYSDNVGTKPAASSGITSIKALSETSVYLEWGSVSHADNYEIEYTTKKSYFDSSSSEVKKMTVESVVHHAEITGLESGNEWFFRVRAANDKGSSAWTGIKSVKLGEPPDIPTTWSSTTTVVVGDPLTLYWVHNSEDGSSQTYAELELDIGGVVSVRTIKNSEDEDEKDKTSFYSVNTSGYDEGVVIKWRVRTRGIMPEYSEWSTQRTVDVYAPPTLALQVLDHNGDTVYILQSFPLHIATITGPVTQTPIGFHLSISANATHETVDNMGNPKIVKAGDEVYSRFFNSTSELDLFISANDVNLDNNIEYTIRCTSSMNSGLTASSSHEFLVAWTDEQFAPDAEIGYDEENYTTFIRPYCATMGGALIDGIMLSVYRREFDGTFTELITGLDNMQETYITDPHPSLDYARYRVVATKVDTGAVSYTDVPGYPIGEKAVIIQWDEEWRTFDNTYDNPFEDPIWAGSLLRLPYNIDVADNHNPDVSLIEYIGRSHPVSYYGTQLGETSTWNVEIDKKDKETLYAIRRLAAWMGNVYVREPSGSGYWAHITVSYSQRHCELTIPITFNLVRVEGGA